MTAQVKEQLQANQGFIKPLLNWYVETADELDALKARVAELEPQLDAAFDTLRAFNVNPTDALIAIRQDRERAAKEVIPPPPPEPEPQPEQATLPVITETVELQLNPIPKTLQNGMQRDAQLVVEFLTPRRRGASLKVITNHLRKPATYVEKLLTQLDDAGTIASALGSKTGLLNYMMPEKRPRFAPKSSKHAHKNPYPYTIKTYAFPSAFWGIKGDANRHRFGSKSSNYCYLGQREYMYVTYPKRDYTCEKCAQQIKRDQLYVYQSDIRGHVVPHIYHFECHPLELEYRS